MHTTQYCSVTGGTCDPEDTVGTFDNVPTMIYNGGPPAAAAIFGPSYPSDEAGINEQAFGVAIPSGYWVVLVE